MRSIVVIWHSQTGGTGAMVEALLEGIAREPGVTASKVHASAAGAADVLEADAVVFATPENLAAISGLLKDFFDRCYYELLERVNGKPCATMVCAGSDGSNAVRQLERITTGLRLRPMAEPLVVNVDAQSSPAITARKVLADGDRARCRELGATLAAGLALGIY